MPKLINAYAADDSLANALSGFATSFLGNTAQQELYRQKAKSALRENENLPLLADAIVARDPAAAARAGILAGQDPKFTAGYGQYYDVQKFGPGSPEGTRSTMAVPGANYGNTVEGTNAEMANRRGIAQMQTDRVIAAEKAKADNALVAIIQGGAPVYTTRSQAVGQTPVISHTEAQGTQLMNQFPSLTGEQQRAAIGAEPKSPGTIYNYTSPTGEKGVTVDGRTDRNTGAPLPQGAQVFKVEGASVAEASNMAPEKPNLADLQRKVVSARDLATLADRANTLVTDDPTIIGLPGQAQKVGQNMLDAARSVATSLGRGTDINSSIDNVRSEAVQRLGANAAALLPDLFKPQISELEAVHAIIVYRAAETLFGQSGRDLSNRDVQAAKVLVGDPHAMFSGPQAFKTKMQFLAAEARKRGSEAEAMLRQNTVSPTGMPGAVAPAQPGAVVEENWVRDANGQLVRGQ